MTAILGGGIAGLSAAYYGLENPKLGSLVLYEASNRLGGWIRSVKSPSGQIFEQGPRTVRTVGDAAKNTLDLVNDLNLNDKIVPLSNFDKVCQNRLIYAKNKLHLLPNSIFSVFKVQEPLNRRLASIILTDLRAPKETKNDESIYNFVERRFGKDIADYFISSVICGICAGDAKEISVKFILKNAFELEQKYGSVSKGVFLNLLSKFSNKKEKVKNNPPNENPLIPEMKKYSWAAWSLRGGLEQLPAALEQNIKSKPNLKINTNTVCEQITFKPSEVELTVNGKVEHYCRAISCLPSKSLAPLLERQHPQLARELASIKFTTVGVVNLYFPGKLFPLPAFGLLVPPIENLPILGITFDSLVSKQFDRTVLTVMMGGAWFNKYFGDSATEEHLLSVAVSQTKNILNIEEDPIEHHVTILKDCIPQYVVGHNERMQRIENYISAHKIPLSICGSSYQGVGVNDVILSAKQAVSHFA